MMRIGALVDITCTRGRPVLSNFTQLPPGGLEFDNFFWHPECITRCPLYGVYEALLCMITNKRPGPGAAVSLHSSLCIVTYNNAYVLQAIERSKGAVCDINIVL